MEENAREHARILRNLSEQLDHLINKAGNCGLKDPDIEYELNELKDILELFEKTVGFDANRTVEINDD